MKRQESLFNRYPVLWVVVIVALLWLFAPLLTIGACPAGESHQGDRFDYWPIVRIGQPGKAFIPGAPANPVAAPIR